MKTIRKAPYLIACSMQHVSTVLTYPGSCKTCFFCIPVFGRKVFLIFPIIYLTVNPKPICIIGLSDIINSFIFANIYPGWHKLTLGASFPFSRISWLLNFIETRHVSFGLYRQCWHYKLHWNFLISHAKTSLFVNCAGGSQAVQLLDWSNKGQVWAIRLRRVWGSLYPSI